jgi:pimeloyl-ACP methyl ester carboxylesterase
MLIDRKNVEVFDIEGAGRIKVAWREFKPAREHSPSQRTVIFIPGWGFSEHAEAINPLCQALANFSHDTTYAVDTRAERIVPQTLLYEAEAVRRFLQVKCVKNVVVVANSHGGGQAGELVVLLQKKNSDIHIEGLILLDSMALYTQTVEEVVRNYPREMLNQRVDLKHLTQLKGNQSLQTQNRKYLREGSLEILSEILHSHIQYPHRLLNEIQGMINTNPHLGDIEVPVVLVHGAHDMLSQPARIIPYQERPRVAGRPFIENVQQDVGNEREAFLRGSLFHKSPYVRMIVPEKAGSHGLLSVRPQSVARSSLYLLERYQRQQYNGPRNLDTKRDENKIYSKHDEKTV